MWRSVLFLVSVPHVQSRGPKQGLQPLTLSPFSTKANHTPGAPYVPT